MKRLRRKPRYCRQCGAALRTSRTGRWYFCNEACQVLYVDSHEPDVDTAPLLEMMPTDEDDEGTVNTPAPVEEPI